MIRPADDVHIELSRSGLMAGAALFFIPAVLFFQGDSPLIPRICPQGCTQFPRTGQLLPARTVLSCFG